MAMMLTAGSLAIFAATEIEETKLSEDEIQALAKASCNVARHYPPQVSAKQQDLLALMYCVGTIGMTHFMMYQARMNEERAQKARDVSPQ